MQKPPAFARWILSRVLHPIDRDFVLGDLEENFFYKSDQHGISHATRWYWYQVLRSIPPLVSRTFYWSALMLNNYLRLAFRNLRKQKGYAAINILGLAIGLTCFILIGLFVQFELSYDRFHERAERIYRIEEESAKTVYLGSNQFAVTPSPLVAVLMDEFPEVEHAAQINSSNALLELGNKRFYEDGIFATPYFLELFSFELIQGNPATALDEPNSIVLTESLARKYFGEQVSQG